MGANQSSSQNHGPVGDEILDTQFDRLWTKLSISGSLTDEEFIDRYRNHDSHLVRSIFRFISMGNPQISKSLMLSRFHDLTNGGVSGTVTRRSGSHTAPFWTIIDAIGFSSREILQVTCMDVSAVAESDTIEILRVRFPNLETIFHSVILSFLLDRPHPLDCVMPTQSSKIVDSTIFRRMRLLLPPTVSDIPLSILFSSQIDGMSFRALMPKIKYFTGGLLFIFQSSTGQVFGCYADRNEWTDTQGFDESAQDSFIFQLSPILLDRKPNRVGSRNFVYMNTNQSNLRPFGIGFGGREGSFRVWIDGSDLSKVSCMESDATFEPGEIVQVDEDGIVVVRSLEVWGFGGDEAFMIQAEKRKLEDSVRQDRRQVDKARLVEHQFDREMLFANTFKNQQAGANRLGS